MTDEELQAIRARQNDDALLFYPHVSPLEANATDDIQALLAEVDRLRTGVALAWSDGWEAALDRPWNAEEAVRYRDLHHHRDVKAILDGTTTD